MAVEQKIIWRPQAGPQMLALECAVPDVFFGGARGGGKRLAHDTPVPVPLSTSPTGWKQHGDLRPGDRVFHPSGRQVEVLAVAQEVVPSQCYAVVFSTGDEIVADAEHLWRTWTRAEWPFGDGMVRTTQHVADSLDKQHGIPACMHPEGDDEVAREHRAAADACAPAGGWRFVVACRPVPPVPMRCIQVDADDGLYLVGRSFITTHNSESLIGKLIQHSETWGKRARSLVVREQFPQLRELIDRTRELTEPLGVRYRATDHRLTWPTGAVAFFGALEREKDADKWQGANLTFFGVDEAGNFDSPGGLNRILASMRSVGGVRVQRFMTGNPGGPGHCIPFGEVLTPSGWVDIRGMAVGDPVFTLNDDGVMVAATVAQTHREHYDGLLWTARSRGLFMQATPGHRVAKVGGRPGARNRPFTLTRIVDLPGQATVLRSVKWDAPPLGDFSPPKYPTRKRRVQQPTSIPGRRYAQLLGWFLSEGCTVDRDKAFGIAQLKAEGRAEITELLDACGFRWAWNNDTAMVYAADWWAHFRQFGKSRDKFIPQNVKSASKEDLAELLRTLMAGDGCDGVYYTISKQLADDVAEIALKCGFVVYISQRYRPNRDGLHYQVNTKRTKSGGSELLTGQHVYAVPTETQRRSQITQERHCGDVYCIGVADTHNFIVRQNGCVWVSGNSWLKERYIDVGQAMRVHRPPKGQPRVFIPSFLDDNQLLVVNDPSYVDRLHDAGPSWLVEAWLKGDWNATLVGKLIKLAHLQRYDETPDDAAFVRRIISLDAAVKDKEWESRNVAQHWGQMEGGAKYLLDEWAEHATYPDLRAAVRAMAMRLRPNALVIEDKGNGSALIQEFRADPEFDIPIEAIEPVTNKILRMDAETSQIDAGMVWVPRWAPWLPPWETEVSLFPQGKWKDRVDAMSLALWFLRARDIAAWDFDFMNGRGKARVQTEMPAWMRRPLTGFRVGR